MEIQPSVIRRWSTEIKIGLMPTPTVFRRLPEILLSGRPRPVVPLIQLDRDKLRATSPEVPRVQPKTMEQAKSCLTNVSAPLPEHHEVVSLISELRSLVTLIQPSSLNTQASPPIAGDKVEKPKRKYTRRKTDQAVAEIPLPQRKWLTFKQAAAIYPKSEQAFRHLARQSEQYQKYPKAGLSSSGFENCVCRQPGSRNIFLNAEALELWMARGQGGVQ